MDAPEKSVVWLFEEQVRANPQGVAIKDRGRSTSYAELNRIANRIAHKLLREQGDKNEPAAVLIDDRATVTGVMFAVYKAGKIYTPLLPSQPVARTRQILQDLRPGLVICDNKNLRLADELVDDNTTLVNVDALDSDLPTENLNLPIPAEHYFGIVYTSGSTGQPKGIAFKNQALVRAASVLSDEDNSSPSDRYLFIASPGFGLAISTMLEGLLNGATLLPFDLEREGFANLREFMLKEKITRISASASTFRHFAMTLDESHSFPDVRYIKLGGEPALRKDLDMIRQHFAPGCLLATSYGSTEAGKITSFTITAGSRFEGNVLPAGRILPDREVTLVGEDGNVVADGEIGEIVIRGRLTSTDYWRNPALTAKSFKTDPADSTIRIFHSGDLGRMRPDRLLEHHGRKDLQVKIRGTRVELAEIEMALFDAENVREAVVIAKPDTDGENRLIAYVAPERKPPPTTSGLRRHLAARLPAYMLPGAFVVLDTLPLNANGKIDRAALPELKEDWNRQALSESRDELESTLTEIWKELLHVASVGMADNFFDLGGHSLLAMQMLALVEKKLGRRYPLSVLFEASTIRDLAALIRQATWSPALEGSSLVAIEARGTKTPFFIAAGGSGRDGELLVYAQLIKYLGGGQPLYGLRAPRILPGASPSPQVSDIAAAHLKEVRAVQPKGPYFLGGECIGGNVAYEMAQQLKAEGEDVQLLVLLDTWEPNTLTRYLPWLRLQHLARFWQRRLPYHLRQFVRLSSRDGAKYIASKAALAKGLVKKTAESHFLDGYSNGNYLVTLSTYRPKPYQGDLTLVVNQVWHGINRNLGWRRLIDGGLEVQAVPGDHTTYIRGNVQHLGVWFSSRLERAQAQRQP